MTHSVLCVTTNFHKFFNVSIWSTLHALKVTGEHLSAESPLPVFVSKIISELSSTLLSGELLVPHLSPIVSQSRFCTTVTGNKQEKSFFLNYTCISQNSKVPKLSVIWLNWLTVKSFSFKYTYFKMSSKKSVSFQNNNVPVSCKLHLCISLIPLATLLFSFDWWNKGSQKSFSIVKGEENLPQNREQNSAKHSPLGETYTPECPFQKQMKHLLSGKPLSL